MNYVMEYKGYTGSVEYSVEDSRYCGVVLGVRALILYEGDTLEELESDFHDAIEDYLTYCREEGKEAEQSHLRDNFWVDFIYPEAVLEQVCVPG